MRGCHRWGWRNNQLACRRTYLGGTDILQTNSRVIIKNINSKIPIIIEPGNIQSILSGTGKDNGVIQYLRKDNKIEDNSIVYTSGSAGIFKAGIPVGKLKIREEIVNKEEKINKEKKVVFFSDFSQLSFVEIVSFKKVDAK